jgi:glucosamine-6-phosphate deaminase
VSRLTPTRPPPPVARPGFRVVLHDTLEEFYLAESLEYVEAWRQSTE